MILFVNACARKESRTRALADVYLSKRDDEIKEVNLYSHPFPLVDEAFLQMRDNYIKESDFSAPVFELARDFANADEIVVAAPFWDMSFPSVLKQYFEQICVLGLTFRYTEDNIPEGLCQAHKMTYITTSGGPVDNWDYGYGYVKALAQGFYGIKYVQLFKAEGLDIDGADVEKIMAEAMEAIK